MQKLKFKNDDFMPALGLGTWKSKPNEVYQAVIDAIETGYRHIDCAPIYGNEAEIGKALSKVINDGVVKREELWITSKLWNNAHAADAVVPALKKTLKDLQLDYLDLFLVHWPVAVKQDVMFPEKGSDMVSLDKIPIAETWKGMEKCVDEGLAKHIGVSNFSIPKLKDLISTATIKPEMNQIELHPFLQQNKMLEYCQAENIYLTAYAPLGSSDRMQAMKGVDEPSLIENKVIVDIAKSHGKSPAQVLIKWALQRGTAVIPKSVNAQRIKQNYEAEDFVLSDDAMQKIADLDQHFRLVNGSFWTVGDSPYTIQNLWDE
jgi:alcohol dehydrogenase (NADP+)